MKFNESYIPSLAKSAPVKAAVVAVANEIAATVRATAPVDTGEYRSRVRVEVTETAYRPVAKVVVDSDHAMIVEAKHGTLARALRAATRG
jgi:hypothetical protein